MDHMSTDQLVDGVEHVRLSPTENGRVELVVNAWVVVAGMVGVHEYLL